MNVGVTQKICPIRYFFLVQPNNEERFRRAIHTASALWGGMYSAIFPFYEVLPDDYCQEYRIDIPRDQFYKNTINNYDPDIILYDEDIEDVKVKALSQGQVVISIEEFLDSFYSTSNNCTSVIDVASQVIDKEFKFHRNDNLKLKVPEFKDNCILLHAICGAVDKRVEDVFVNGLSSNNAFERPLLDWTTLKDYRAAERIDIQSLANYELNLWDDRPHSAGEAVYFLDATRLRDVMNFWNLRAAGWHVLPVAIDRSDNGYFPMAFDRFIKRHRAYQDNKIWVTLLVPRNMQKAKIDDAINNLIKGIAKKDDLSLSRQWWFPRFWADQEIKEADHIQSGIPYMETRFEHQKTFEETQFLDIPILPFPFHDEFDPHKTNAFKVILELSPRNDNLEYAEVIDGIDSIQARRLLDLFSFNELRLSKTLLHILTRSGNIHLTIPKAIDFFRQFFSNRGYKLKPTANSRLAGEVLRNMGGVPGSKRFMLSPRLKIIESFEGGKVITYDGLLAIYKRLTGINKNGEAVGFINMLLEHKIIEMGAEVQCKFCEQHGFYLPEQINQALTCPVCRNTFELPKHSPKEIVWAYRGIGPFSRNNKAEGVMAVFATLNLFRSEFASMDGPLSVLLGFELAKHGDSSQIDEVDLALLIKSRYGLGRLVDLLLCECKTYKYFEQKDIDRMIILGNAFPDAILVLATLNERLQDEERELLKKLVVYFQQGDAARPRNPILILTGKELLPEDFRGAFKAYKSELSEYQRNKDFIGAVCDLSIRKHLGISNWGEIRMKKWTDQVETRHMIGNIIEALQQRVKEKKI